MSNHFFKISYQLLYDTLFLSYFLFLWHFITHSSNALIIPFIIILYSFGLLLLHFEIKGQAQKRTIYLLVAVPIAIILLSLINVPFIFTPLLVVYIIARIRKAVAEQHYFLSSNTAAFLVSVFIAMLTYMLGMDQPIKSSVLNILVCQIFVFFAGTFFSNLVVAQLEKRTKYIMFGQFLTILSGVGLLAFILTQFVHPIRSFIGILFSIILFPLRGFINGFVGFVYQVLSNGQFEGVTTDSELQSDSRNEDFIPPEAAETETNIVLTIMTVLLVITIAVTIYLLLKKKKGSLKGKAKEKQNIILEQMKFGENLEEQSFAEYKQSNVLIRKIMHRFEKRAKKFHKGRKTGETVFEWFKRIKLNRFDMVTIYEKVRYGELPGTKEEMTNFLQFIKEVEQQWMKEAKFKK